MDRKRILEIGLQMEKSAREFYYAAVEKVSDAGTKAMLKELALQEEVHVQMFEDALAGKDVEFGKGLPEPGQSLGLGETLEAPRVSDASDPGDILIIAIKAEMRAIQFYQESLASFAGTETEQMLRGLVAEEQVHKDRLERIYDEEYLQHN
jgi:rubrerythrin